MKNSIDLKIARANHAIENTLNNPQILKKMSAYSYDRKKLQAGKALNEKAHMLQLAKHESYGAQYTSTDALEADLAQTKILYNKHLVLARLVFEENRGMQAKLQLKSARKRAKDAWLSQARVFYSRAEEIGPEMGKYGISREMLEQARAMVEALMTTRQQQMQRMGEAQSATCQRDQAIKAMEAWMRDFRQVARLALQDDPQMLEALGIQVPSKKV